MKLRKPKLNKLKLEKRTLFYFKSHIKSLESNTDPTEITTTVILTGRPSGY